MTKELLTWTCPICGKILTSLYQKQLDQNSKVHSFTHSDSCGPRNVGCVQVDKEAKQ